MQGIGSPSEPPRTGRPSCVLGDGQLPTKLVSYGLHSKSGKHFSRLTVQLLLQSGRLYPSLLCILNNKQSCKLAKNYSLPYISCINLGFLYANVKSLIKHVCNDRYLCSYNFRLTKPYNEMRVMRELSRVALQLVSPTGGHDAVASAYVDRQVAASSVVTPTESSGRPASFCRWSPGGGTYCSSACALDEWTSRYSLCLQCSSSGDFRGS